MLRPCEKICPWVAKCISADLFAPECTDMVLVVMAGEDAVSLVEGISGSVTSWTVISCAAYDYRLDEAERSGIGTRANLT